MVPMHRARFQPLSVHFVGAVLVVWWTWVGSASATATGSLTPHLVSHENQLLLSLAPTLSVRQRLTRFYLLRQHRPVWVDRDGLTESGRTLLTVLSNAGEHGFDPGNYSLHAIWQRIDRLTPGAMDLELEMLLTIAALQHAQDMGGGRVPQHLRNPERHIAPPRQDWVTELHRAVTRNDLREWFEDLVPKHSGYRTLQRLHRHLTLVTYMGDWPSIGPGPIMRLGRSDARVPLLRWRLAREFDFELPEPVLDATYYDAPLATAVRRVQRRYGLRGDGKVGPQTLAQLNIPARQRLAQVRLNLERWHWLPRELGERYLLVDIAGYQIYLESTRRRVAFPAIVGRSERPTPVFTSRMTHVIVNPRWNVPKNIAGEDLLPKIQKDPNYLTRRGFKVYKDWREGSKPIDPETVEWRKLSAETLPYRFQQQPGANNALGKVKFRVPNALDIFLHDTPERGLFNHSVRTFSSGCVRLKNPLELARHLLPPRQAGELDTSSITRWHRLEHPLPVHFVYLTVGENSDGELEFRPDIYQLDALQGALCPQCRIDTIPGSTASLPSLAKWQTQLF